MLKYIPLAVLIFLTACGPRPETSDSKMSQQQEKLSAEAVSEVGIPAIVNFQEKRMMKQILELRDQTISTVTYLTDMNGHLHKLCDSVGYGLPYATQYTNPQKAQEFYATPGGVALPQADPNGLFSPAGADGTWVMCLNPVDNKVKPVFVEPRIITSPFPLKID